MYQKWRDLSFLHFSIDPHEIQALLPEGLTIDTFPDEAGRESAWVGLVPFWMTGIRLRGLPAVPGLSTFPETNVRTYVHRNGQEPGVWFFSLDASNRLACAWARKFYGLPYYYAKMQATKYEDEWIYASERRSEPKTKSTVIVKVGDPLPDPEPGSWEFFVIERYMLYALRKGKLFTGMVHHSPYSLHAARVTGSDSTLVTATGITPGLWRNTLYSPGVDVEVFGIQPVQ
jgi:uncharacterized protein YqjF (DUF2071 family)